MLTSGDLLLLLGDPLAAEVLQSPPSTLMASNAVPSPFETTSPLTRSGNTRECSSRYAYESRFRICRVIFPCGKAPLHVDVLRPFRLFSVANTYPNWTRFYGPQIECRVLYL